jgi:hypothetical protein
MRCFVVALVLGAVFLAACGEGEKKSKTPAPAASIAASAPSESRESKTDGAATDRTSNILEEWLRAHGREPQAVQASPPSRQKDEPVWQAQCLPESGLSHVSFRSPSGDVTEDDMLVSIAWSNGATSPVSVKPAWFLRADFSTNLKNQCKDIGAFELSSERLLLWVSFSGRPRSNHLAVFLVNPRQRAIVDVLSDVGEGVYTEKYPMVLRRGDHFEALMDKEWLLQPGDGEFPAPDWMSLSVVGDRLKAAWRD